MKIYVITKGEYSDYHICAVTDDLERAKTLVMYYSSAWEDANIEEFDTEEPIINTEPRPIFSISIKRDGTITQEGKQAWTYDPNYENEYNLYTYKYPICLPYYLDFSAVICAEDYDHALKIAIDKRNQMIAEHLGL